MGCCVGRNKKVDPVAQLKNDWKIQDAVSLPPSPSRIKPSRSETIRVHKRVDMIYTIHSAIGKGAFGHVIRVEHKETKKPYAIKIIDLSKDVKDEKKLEVEILRTVNHKYVIQLHDVISAPGKLYLVMGLATGGELFDRIYQLGHFDESHASRVLSMILEGIKYLHSVGITHRDLKPENILYYHPGKNSRIIITDFGLAKIRKYADNALMNTDCGTIEYMAPEVITKDPYTNAVDMWSIGVITYILLSGKMPFPVKGNVYRLLRMICFGVYNYISEPWNSISNEAKAFIDSLLLVEPSKRLTASQALEHKWIKQTRHKKMNLQRSISSNWTESCVSLNSIDSKAGKSRKHDQNPKREKRNTNADTYAIDCSRDSVRACDVSKRCLNSNSQQRDYNTIHERISHVDKHTIHEASHVDKHTIHEASHVDKHTIHEASLVDKHTSHKASHVDKHTIHGASHVDKHVPSNEWSSVCTRD